ncbi:MAG: PAS domain S-box protein [Sphingobacteriales bacterium]|nr:MAG: PAS domain S-box protein [Sphingobacteriales bacterium]
MQETSVIHNDQLQFILNSAGLGTWDLDTLNQEVSWDERCRALYGIFHDGDISYQQVMDYIHPADAERVNSAVLEALSGKNGGNYEERFRVTGVEDGKLRWLLCRGKAYFGEDGKPFRFSGTALDVTEQEQSKEAAAMAAEQLELAIESGDLGTFTINVGTGEVLYNEAFTRILTGTHEKGLNHKIFVEHIYGDDMPMRNKAIALSHETGKVLYTARFVWHDGSVHWVKVSGKYINKGDGQPALYSGVVQDVTGDMEVRAEQHKMLSLIDNSTEYVAIASNDGQLTYMNNAGKTLLGMPLDTDVTKINTRELYTPAELHRVNKTVLPSLNRNGYWSGKLNLRHLATGEEIPCYSNTIVLYDPATGAQIGRGSTLRDLRQEQVVQDALKDIETRFSNLVMQAPVAIGIFSGENFILETANDFMLEILGADRSIIDRPLLKAIPQIIGQPFAELLDETYHSNKPKNGYELESLLYRNRRLDHCYFNFVYSPVQQQGSNAKSIIVVGTEVTELVAAQKDIKESEQRFKSLLADAPIATSVYTGRGLTITVANDAMIRLWGKDESVIGMHLADALPELQGQPFLQILDRVYTTGTIYHTSEQRADLVVDGELQTFYFNFTYKPLFDSYGKVYAILNMAVDITEQVMAREAEKFTEERLHTAIELAELGTWSLDPQTGTTILSPRMKHWFGIDEDTPTLDNDLESIHPKDRSRVLLSIERALEVENQGEYDEEYTVVNRKTGEERVLHVKGKVTFDEHGKPLNMTGKAQDVTLQLATQRELEKLVDRQTQELQAALSDLERTNANLEQYAYVASHDLQEPLRKIRMFTDILQNKSSEELSEESKSYLDRISAAAGRMSTLVKEILAFSKLRRKEEDFVETDLNKILTDITGDFEVAIAENNIDFHVDNLPVISGIPVQMNQLFYNLVGNAIKFSRNAPDSYVHITCKTLTPQEVQHYPQLNASWPYCEIIVRDNGIGFDPTFAEQIFIMFRRLNTREAYPGTGIGLALCKKIMLNHSGDIFAHGVEGEGSSFHILLPLARD